MNFVTLYPNIARLIERNLHSEQLYRFSMQVVLGQFYAIVEGDGWHAVANATAQGATIEETLDKLERQCSLIKT